MIRRMGIAAVLAAIGTLAIFGTSRLHGTTESPLPVPPVQVGMTLGPLAYWEAQWPFIDLVQGSAMVRYVDPAGGWPPAILKFRFDAAGHPVDIPRGTTLAIPLVADAPQIPAGRYRCLISDGWDVTAFGAWTKKGDGTAFTMTIANASPRAKIVIQATARRDHSALEALSCVREGVTPIGPFSPEFIDDIRPYKVLRFMDWMKTNNAPLRKWAERPTPGSFSQAGDQGVALEHMIALANATKSDPWFNMPFDADPGYYRNFATYVRDHLDKSLKVYVEFSNEVWNESFGQGKQATARGQALYPGVDAPTANDYYYADRVRAVMADWTDVFGPERQRVVRVLAEQAAWAERTERALKRKDTWRSVDVVAIAPYFGINPRTLTGTGAARIDRVFDNPDVGPDNAIATALKVKRIAAQYHLRLITYEGGPSIHAYGPPDLTADLIAANRDPRMYPMYRRFLDRWRRDVGDVLVLYASHQSPGGPGAFGHREYRGQPLSEAPKARAVADFAREAGGN